MRYSARVSALTEEVFLPHETTPRDVPLATQVRGTVLLGSLRSLRARGFGDRYLSLVDPRHRETLVALTAATWLPIEVAIAHYEACEALQLDRATIEAVGAEAGLFVNQTVQSVVARVSREVGVTPWFALGNAHKFRARTWVGSSIAIYKLGPKDARFEWIQFPIARIPYVRVAFGAFAGAIGGLFARTMVVRDLLPGSRKPTLSYRLSWV